MSAGTNESIRLNGKEAYEDFISVKTAEILVEAGVVQFDFENGFTFVSGVEGSPIYVDVRKAFYTPESRKRLREVFENVVRHETNYEVVAGVASGGILPAHHLADVSGKELVYVAKSKKKYGLGQAIECGPVSGKKVVVVDDTVNRGTNSLPAVETILKEGGGR